MFCVITLSIWHFKGQIEDGTPLVHQLPASATIENQLQVAIIK
jgi:hypothetical protein